jgi:hypothetical protein
MHAAIAKWPPVDFCPVATGQNSPLGDPAASRFPVGGCFFEKNRFPLFSITL